MSERLLPLPPLDDVPSALLAQHLALSLRDRSGVPVPGDARDARWVRTRARHTLRCDVCLTRSVNDNPPPPLTQPISRNAGRAPVEIPTLHLLSITHHPPGGRHERYAVACCPNCHTYYWRPEEVLT